VWYRHESGERWSSEDGVVLRGPVNDLEFDLLLSEVCWRAEDDVEMYRPNGYVSFPRTIPWKEISVGRRLFIGILIFCSVSA
jgi:hypothetical protein